MKIVYLICGVPGSGKTWVCESLKGLATYVPIDRYHESALMPTLEKTSNASDTSIVLDCPFGERLLRGRLEAAGFTVRPFFIVEPVHVVQERYYQREGRYLGKAHVTRATTILDRALEWQAPYGTSEEILCLLKAAL